MKIKLKSTVQQAKTFDYVLHTLEVTEANILDYRNLANLFYSLDTSKWEEKTQEIDIPNYPSLRNIKENSFDITIDDYDNNSLEVLKQFLTDNEKVIVVIKLRKSTSFVRIDATLEQMAGILEINIDTIFTV